MPQSVAPHIRGWPRPHTGILFLLNGPPGVGKDTAARHVINKTPNLERIVSWTTRPKDPHETDGESHMFVSEEEFLAAANASGGFVEQVQSSIARYGTRRCDVTNVLDVGRSAIMIANTEGMYQTKVSLGVAYTIVTIFLMPPSRAVLADRIRQRERQDGTTLAARLQYGEYEIAHADEYDYAIVNDHLDATVSLMHGIIAAETVRATSGMVASRRLGPRPD